MVARQQGVPVSVEMIVVPDPGPGEAVSEVWSHFLSPDSRPRPVSSFLAAGSPFLSCGLDGRKFGAAADGRNLERLVE